MSYSGDVDDYAIDQITSGGTDPVSNRKNVIAIRFYGERARTVILEKRAAFRARGEANARRWQHSTSRRALRNRHYDSVAIREKYVRGSRSFDEYAWLSTNAAYIEHGRWHRTGGVFTSGKR